MHTKIDLLSIPNTEWNVVNCTCGLFNIRSNIENERIVYRNDPLEILIQKNFKEIRDTHRSINTHRWKWYVFDYAHLKLEFNNTGGTILIA